MASGDGAAENGAEEKVTEGGFICRHEMFACDLCGLPVKRGERIYPVRPEGEGKEIFAREWVHYSCAQSHDVIAAMDRRPICKHWAKKGFCSYEAKCFFAHPAEACGKCMNLKAQKFGDAALRSGGGVLDIAGGKGELSFLFENLNGISSTCIEPRPLQLRSFVRRFTFGMYHRSTLSRRHVTRSFEEGMREIRHVRMCLSEGIVEALKTEDSKLDSLVGSSIEEAQTKIWTTNGLHDDEHCKGACDESDNEKEDVPEETKVPSSAEKYTISAEAKICAIGDSSEVIRIMKNASFIAGMHPDQATGPLVDLALCLRVPFAVVPCCVYSKEFPRRQLRDGTRVKSYDSFLQFLAEKDPGIQQETLEFEGKNKVLFWFPPKTCPVP